MDVIILAGGMGTRLKSVVKDIPKPMAIVAGHPFLRYLIEYLSRFDVSNVIFATGYKSEIIEDWVKRHNFGFKSQFSVENQPLGTGGAIKKAAELSGSKNICVLNGDTFFDVDLKALEAAYAKARTPVCMALKPMQNFDRYGNVELDTHGRVVAFKEKEFCAKGQINGGVYMLNTSILFDKLPEKFSLENDVFKSAAQNGKVTGFFSDGYFIDIGIPEDYARADRELPLQFHI